ncbi:MAG: sensor histidine kinase N-terminal domain-containing protein [Gammaproteobacteria bacterium]|nr:sensor histidine kinase N-terminal domain-containing protein [Gammaproteobacteria bacterium]
MAALYGYRTSALPPRRLLFDAQLSDTASLIAALLAAQPPETTSEADRGLTPSAGQAAFQIWTEDQRLILYSADAPTTAIAPFEPGFHDRNSNNQALARAGAPCPGQRSLDSGRAAPTPAICWPTAS